MNVPQVLLSQVKEYGRAGFHVIRTEPRAGAHFKVWFAEFDEPQFITKNAKDWRSLKNNIAKFKRLAAKRRETDEEQE